MPFSINFSVRVSIEEVASSKINIFGLQIPVIPSLYGTFSILVLISVVKHLPFASKAGTSNMMQISYELEEAGQIAGAGFFHRFAKIVFPLAKNGFWSGFMLIFISIIKELDLLALLMTPKQQTLPFMAFAFAFTVSSMANFSSRILTIRFCSSSGGSGNGQFKMSFLRRFV